MPWQPDSLLTMQVMVAVLCDTRPSTPIECHLLHGATARSERHDKLVLDCVIDAYNGDIIGGTICLNGFPAAEATIDGIPKLAYRGYEPWQEYLLGEQVCPEDIHILPAGSNTPEEDRAFLKFAQERGSQILGITSYSYHQPRCFAQIISIMDDEFPDYKPKVYNLAGYGMSVTDMLNKPVTEGPDVVGSMLDQVAGEYERLVKYAEPTGKWIPHATFERVLEYMRWRDTEV